MTYDDLYDYSKAAVENLAGPLMQTGPATDVLYPKDFGDLRFLPKT